MINLRFEAWTLPLNPIVCRKAVSVYCYRTTFSPSAINILWRTRPGIKIFYVGLVRDTDILVEALPRYRKTFSLLTFTWDILFSLFLSFMLWNNIVISLVNPKTAVQSPSFIVKNCIRRRPCIWGGNLAS